MGLNFIQKPFPKGGLAAKVEQAKSGGSPD